MQERVPAAFPLPLDPSLLPDVLAEGPLRSFLDGSPVASSDFIFHGPGRVVRGYGNLGVPGSADRDCLPVRKKINL